MNTANSTSTRTPESLKSELNTDVIPLPEGIGIDIRDSQGNLLALVACLDAQEGVALLGIKHPIEPPALTLMLAEPSHEVIAETDMNMLVVKLNQMKRENPDFEFIVDWEGDIQIRRGL